MDLYFLLKKKMLDLNAYNRSVRMPPKKAQIRAYLDVLKLNSKL